MKVAILYGSRHKLTGAHKQVHHSRNSPEYYVRVEFVDAPSDVDALTMAKPTAFETLLNTIEIQTNEKHD